jgi:TolB-like protein/class 3 adenylate cyclase
MPPEGFKRKLTAILNADVEGYSRLMRENEETTIRTLTTYRGAMATLIQKYRGRVVDSPGDNLLAEFASVVDAVQCAVEIQRELAERNAELPAENKMAFRIGVNLGDVVEEDGRIYGDGVNIAARLESVCEGGGICISRTAFEHIEHKLDLEFEDLGDHEVKNITKPVRVYRVLSYPGAAAHRVVKAKRALQMKWRKSAMALAVLLVIGAGAVAVWNFFLRPSPPLEPASVEKMAFPLPDKPSIAVMPFVNMSGDPKQEYFSDGITEDLITDISKISGLFVIARNSVFTYKGRPVKIRQIAEELGVHYVLEGSVRREEHLVRINAQLIDATTGWHLWAERYDGKMDNVFALQNSIAQKIVSALKVKLTLDAEKQLASKDTKSIGAYDAFLRGWTHYRQHTPEDFAMAVTYLKEAVKQDPEYSRAYAALALVYWEGAYYHRWKYLKVSYSEAILKVKDYLKEAMKVPTPLAHSVASQIHKREGRYQEAITEAAHAISLDSSDPVGYRAMADALIWSGNPIQSAEFIQKAIRLDPHNSSDYLDLLGMAQFNMEQFDKAAISLEQYVKLNSDAEWSYLWLAATYGHLGRQQEAKSAINSFNERMEKLAWNYMSTLQGVEVLSLNDLKDEERLREGLRIAGVPPGHKPFAKAIELISLTKEGHFEVEGVPTVDVHTTKTLLDRGVLLIDVRPDVFWNSGHIPGAIHLQDNAVFSKAWLSKVMNKDEEVIFYCEGAG